MRHPTQDARQQQPPAAMLLESPAPPQRPPCAMREECAESARQRRRDGADKRLRKATRFNAQKQQRDYVTDAASHRYEQRRDARAPARSELPTPRARCAPYAQICCACRAKICTRSLIYAMAIHVVERRGAFLSLRYAAENPQVLYAPHRSICSRDIFAPAPLLMRQTARASSESICAMLCARETTT